MDNRRQTERRRLLAVLAASAVAIPFTPRRSLGQSVAIEVWTGPSCSCCHDWISHLRGNGFVVSSHNGGNSAARKRLGIPVRYGSCHTAEAGGYAIEGHVPAREMHRLLAERPEAIGLSVPAMPRGAPGMDGPAYQGVRDPYDVLLIDTSGKAHVYQSYR